MAKRRPSGDGMVRKRDDGRWEGRIVIGHKDNGEPLFRHVYAKTQKALLDKLHQNIESYRDVELTEDSRMTLGEWLDRYNNDKTFFSGILQVVCSVIAAMAFTYNGIGVVEFGGYMAMFDWAVIWPIFTFIMKYLSYIGVAIVILVLVMIPQLQYKKDPEGYFLCVSDYEAYKEHMKKKEAAAL